MADMDNDGFKEIFVTNGIVKDVLDQDYTDFYFVTERMRQIYREKGAVIKEMIDHIPSVPISNYMFTHQGDLHFSNIIYRLEESFYLIDFDDMVMGIFRAPTIPFITPDAYSIQPSENAVSTNLRTAFTGRMADGYHGHGRTTT